MKKKMKDKVKYYAVHAPTMDGFTKYFEASFPSEPNMDDIVAYAVDSGVISPEKADYVNDAYEVSKKEYDKARKVYNKAMDMGVIR